MASFIVRLLKMLAIAAYLFFFGVVYTVLSPLGKIWNNQIKKRARQLNIQAAKNLQCDAESVLVVFYLSFFNICFVFKQQ
jgi:hypothetical protein